MKMVKLGDVCEIVSGATPRTGVPGYWDGDVPWVTPADLRNLDGAYIAETPRMITDVGLRSCASTLLPVGSVLLSSRAPIGYVAINDVPMATNQGFKSLVLGSQVDAKYIYYWLRGNTSYLQSLGNGATFKELSKSTVERIRIPVPSLEEQHRIAAILDQADAIRAKRLRLLDHLEEFSSSLFRHTVGAESSRSITPQRHGVNECGWRWVRLESVAQLATGHTPDRNRDEYWNGDIPWISLPDIRGLDGRVAMETSLYVTGAGIANSSAVVLPAGTVCLSRTASVGFVTKMGRNMSTSQDFHNWIPGSSLNSDYLMAALRCSRQHLLGATDGSTHKTIYQRTARDFQILLPPRSVQDRFASRLAIVNSEMSRVRRALAADDELFESLQYRAFRGEL